MNNPWEERRHDYPLEHAQVNPTTKSKHIPIGDSIDEQSQTPPPVSGPHADAVLFGYKFMRLSIALSVIFGPLGLFYVSFVNGLAALVVVSTVIPALALPLAASMGGGQDLAVMIGIPIAWCMTVPWAVIATKRHNAKL
jgi:hypothetical protein